MRVQVDDTYLTEHRRISFVAVVVWLGCRLLSPVFVVCDSALLQNVLAIVVAGIIMSVCCICRQSVVVVVGSVGWSPSCIRPLRLHVSICIRTSPVALEFRVSTSNFALRSRKSLLHFAFARCPCISRSRSELPRCSIGLGVVFGSRKDIGFRSVLDPGRGLFRFTLAHHIRILHSCCPRTAPLCVASVLMLLNLFLRLSCSVLVVVSGLGIAVAVGLLIRRLPPAARVRGTCCCSVPRFASSTLHFARILPLRVAFILRVLASLSRLSCTHLHALALCRVCESSIVSCRACASTRLRCASASRLRCVFARCTCTAHFARRLCGVHSHVAFAVCICTLHAFVARLHVALVLRICFVARVRCTSLVQTRSRPSPSHHARHVQASHVALAPCVVLPSSTCCRSSSCVRGASCPHQHLLRCLAKQHHADST